MSLAHLFTHLLHMDGYRKRQRATIESNGVEPEIPHRGQCGVLPKLMPPPESSAPVPRTKGRPDLCEFWGERAVGKFSST